MPPNLLQTERELHRHDHADEHAGHGDDADRGDAQRLDLLQDRVALEGPTKTRANAAEQHAPEHAQVLEQREHLVGCRVQNEASGAGGSGSAPGSAGSAARLRRYGVAGREACSMFNRARGKAFARSVSNSARRARRSNRRRCTRSRRRSRPSSARRPETASARRRAWRRARCAAPRGRRGSALACDFSLALGELQKQVLGERRQRHVVAVDPAATVERDGGRVSPRRRETRAACRPLRSGATRRHRTYAKAQRHRRR